MRTRILKKIAFRNAQKCPAHTLGCQYYRKKMSLTSSFCGIVTCDGKFYIYAYLQYI